MKKKIQKPFDVKDAQNGAKVETKYGKAIRILCYDRIGSMYPIVALFNDDGFEYCVSYTIDGKAFSDNDFDNYSDSLDLIIIDEIESKFDEGDYIVSDIGNIYEITRIDDMYHTKQLSSGYEQRWTIEDINRTFHKWTIQDAKPGYVLCCEDGRPFMLKALNSKDYPIAYFGIDTTDRICRGTDTVWTYDKVRPATFREYNRLFKELKEENYEYNVDTHEITKQEISWRNREDLNTKMSGYYIGVNSDICSYHDGILCKNSYNVFATKKQAKAALAMARISQIMTNDKRFGGIIPDEEWMHHDIYVILRHNNTLMVTTRHCYEYLGFNKREQAELFLEENEDLVKDYYMLD